MEDLLIESNPLQTPPDDPTPDEQYIPTKTKHKPLLIPVITIIGLLLFSGVAYGSYHYFNGFKQQNQKTATADTASQSPLATTSSAENQLGNNGSDQKTNSIDSTVVAATPKMSVKPTAKPTPNATPKATPTSMPKPSLLPTATPVTFDLSTNNATTTIRRYYNSGDGRGVMQQLPSSHANDGPVFDELSPLWNSYVELCTKIKTTNGIYGYNINFLPVVDTKEQTQQLVGSVNIPANQEYEVCSKYLGAEVGVHTYQVKFNSYRNYPESNYSNNVVEANYTILADNKPPTFVIYGPNSKPEGTCFHVNDVSDNVSSFSDISFTYKFDSSGYTNLVDYACFTGQDGNTHNITIRGTDKRGNATENSRSFSSN